MRLSNQFPGFLIAITLAYSSSFSLLPIAPVDWNFQSYHRKTIHLSSGDYTSKIFWRVHHELREICDSDVVFSAQWQTYHKILKHFNVCFAAEIFTSVNRCGHVDESMFIRMCINTKGVFPHELWKPGPQLRSKYFFIVSKSLTFSPRFRTILESTF